MADALEALRGVIDFNAGFRATVHITHIALASGEFPGLVDVRFEDAHGEMTYVASLATSARFQAIREDSQREDFEIDRLHSAVVDSAGNVTLADGQKLRGVEVEPTFMPYKPTELEWRIVHLTLSMIEGAERCYRSLGHGLPEPHAAALSHFRFLDCSTLSGLPVPPLKAIAAHISTQDPTLKKLSQQKIADALRTFGIRRVPPRPRRD